MGARSKRVVPSRRGKRNREGKKRSMSYLRWVMTIVPRRTPAYSPVSMI